MIDNTSRPKFFYGYIIVLVSSYIMLAVAGTFYSFGVFFEPILIEFGWTRAITSGAYSLHLLITCAVGVFMGRLNDRFGPRFILTAAGFFSGAGYLLLSQLGEVWQIYLLFGLLGGIGMGCILAPLLSTIPRWFDRRRGMMMGLSLASCGLGAMLIPPVATQFIVSYGWRVTFVIIGSVILVTVIIAAQFLKRDPGQVGQSPYGEHAVKQESLNLQHTPLSYLEIIRIRQFWMLAGIYASNYSCMGIIFLHIAIHTTGLGVPATTAANVLAIIGGSSVAGRLVMGTVADRIGNRLAVIFGLAMMTASLLWLLVAKEVWMFYLFAIVFGFAYGNVTVLESPLAAELFGLGSLGMLVGGVDFASSGFSVPSPMVAGYIFDVTNSYQLAFLLAASLSIMALMLALFLRPINGEAQSEM